MKKILFLTRSFYPNVGGVEKHIAEISKVLAAKGFEITIITEAAKKTNWHSNAGSATFTGKSKNIRIIEIQARNEGKLKKFLIWFDLIKYINILSSSSLVHCHDVFYWYLPFRFLFPFKNVYTTFHGYEGNNMPNKKSILMHKIAEVLSHGNICVGDFLKKWYGTKPTFVTYGAVDKKIFGIKNKRSRSNKKAIFIGRLVEETGAKKYVQALKLLKDKGVDLEVDFYGEGSLEDELKKYSKDNKLSVTLKGWAMNIEDVLDGYEYFFCSRYLSVLEAMAVNKPIFAEYNNAIKEDYLRMAPFAKYISISETPDQITQSLYNYMRGSEKLDVESAYKWVKDKDWEYMANLYLRLWNLR